MSTQSVTEAMTGKAVMAGPIILLGSPGAGKGTQAKVIAGRYGVPHISTGDILRDNVARGTKLGRKAKAIMERGDLVPDDLVLDMVRERLSCADCDKGFVLDGFPRTLAQAEWLDRFLTTRTFAGRSLPPIVINVQVGYNQLLQRLTGRRTCPTSGHIYNVYFQPPRREGVCDFDGAPLIQRKDDSEEVISERLKSYERKTMPVTDYYRGQGRLYGVNGELPVGQVTAEVLLLIDRLRAAHD
ncbi:MAG TPA: adenylate kinase [Candidatus Angelobacter sp.]